MATKLYRLGHWCFGHRKMVVAAWVTVLVAVGFSAVTFSGQQSEKFEVPGTESQRAQDVLEKKYPAASGTYARVVYAAPEGHRLTEDKYAAGVNASVKELSHADDVGQVVSPFESGAMSKDRRIGFADVIYPVPADEIGDGARDELEAAADPAKDSGLQVEFNGGLVRRRPRAAPRRWA
jgi:RND superfamily putative drug exporter